MNLSQYIKPELSVLIPVLWAIGSFIKRTKLPDCLIPFILGVFSIILATIYTMSTISSFTIQGILGGIFSGITQGILTVSTAVYTNQLLKQGQEGQALKRAIKLKKASSADKSVK